jgi:hypothetical protein
LAQAGRSEDARKARALALEHLHHALGDEHPTTRRASARPGGNAARDSRRTRSPHSSQRAVCPAWQTVAQTWPRLRIGVPCRPCRPCCSPTSSTARCSPQRLGDARAAALWIEHDRARPRGLAAASRPRDRSRRRLLPHLRRRRRRGPLRARLPRRARVARHGGEGRPARRRSDAARDARRRRGARRQAGRGRRPGQALRRAGDGLGPRRADAAERRARAWPFARRSGRRSASRATATTG